MFSHMNKRTTLILDAALYAELKSRATREGRTLTEIVERTLREGLAARGVSRKPRLKLPSYDLGPFLVDPARPTRLSRPEEDQ